MRIKKCHLQVTILCTITLFVLLLSEVYSKPILIRFSHVVGENTPKGKGATMFRELVEQRLAGRVNVEIYPGSQKYTDEQAILGILFGDVELAAPSFPKFRKFSTALQIFDLPFLFENLNHIHKFQQSDVGRQLLAVMEKRGIKGLRYWDNGFRVMSANKPVSKPSDLRGLKFRIEPSYVFQRQYERLGVIATPMPFKHLPDALRGGVVDGYENAWSNILSLKLHLLRPYFTEVGHSYLGYMVVTNHAFWQNLPEDVRSELNVILDEVTQEVNRLAKEKEETDKKTIMADENVQVLHLSGEEKKAWEDVMIPIWQEFESVIGVEIMKAAINSRNPIE